MQALRDANCTSAPCYDQPFRHSCTIRVGCLKQPEIQPSLCLGRSINALNSLELSIGRFEISIYDFHHQLRDVWRHNKGTLCV